MHLGRLYQLNGYIKGNLRSSVSNYVIVHSIADFKFQRLCKADNYIEENVIPISKLSA